MTRGFASCVCVLLLMLPCGCESTNRSAGGGGGGGGGDHGADGVPHRVYTTDQVTWQPGPPSLLPGAQMAVLEGDPTKPGFFAMRLRFPDGFRIMPHTHPKQERVTVISGTLNLGNGATFDKAAARPLPAGSYSTMTPGMQHFGFATGLTEIQLAAMGPWVINYVNPADDPRKASPSTRAASR
jgi:quercetin dioxygenase-like cupin family protein